MCCGNVPSVSQSVFVETYEEGWEEAHLVGGVCSTAGSEGRLKMDASGLENTHTHTHMRAEPQGLLGCGLQTSVVKGK